MASISPCHVGFLSDWFRPSAITLPERSERPIRHVGCEGYGLSHVAFVIHFHYRGASMKVIQTIQMTSKPRRLHAAVRTQLVETKSRCTLGSND